MEAPSPLEKILEKLPPAVAARYRIALKMRDVREVPRVLIVEDQLFSRKILQEFLDKTYTVDLTASTKEGWRLFLENAPDIAFLDIELAEESGHELARLIKTLAPETYVVMVTANHSVEDVRMAKVNKVDGFIVKPYNKARILEILEKYFALHPDRRPKG